jgi:ribosome-associated toxin RatA of RatAB toxin-antitoxin module
MPQPLLARARALMPCRWVQGYGLSETYGPFCWLDEPDHAEGRQLREAHCAGRPEESMRVRLDPVPGHPGNVGEILVSGADVMRGYCDVRTGRLEPVSDWLRTGDLGAWGQDGHLLLKGRIQASILTENGHRVYPEEVEAVLADVPGVEEAVVVGLPTGGAEQPVACVHGPICTLAANGLRQSVLGVLADRLSREKWPVAVYLADAPLPRSANDKIRRAEVRDRIDPAALVRLSIADPSTTEEQDTMRYQATHSIQCGAPPEVVYAVISDSAQWPELLAPCDRVTVLESDAGGELIEVRARVGGVPMCWRSRRTFRPEVHGVDAAIVEPMPLVADMRTSWRIVPVDAGTSLVVLEHDYTLRAEVAGLVDEVATHEQAHRFIADGIHRNSTTELADIRAAAECRVAERRTGAARHSVVCVAPVDTVYQLVRDTRNWPRIFEACLDAVVLERDGDVELVRIHAEQEGEPVSWCTRRTYHDGIHRIDYELTEPMPFLADMRGQWRVVPLDEHRCLLTVERRWTLLPDVSGIRGGIDTVAEAARFVAVFVDGNAEDELREIRELVEHTAGIGR